MPNEMQERDAKEALPEIVKNPGSSLVCTSDCSWLEINTARRAGRLFVTEDGIGFVLRLARGRGDTPAAGSSEKHRNVIPIDHHPGFRLESLFGMRSPRVA